MFSGTVETPRPLPPAKARRASAAAMQKLKLSGSSTPPPAYGSPFTTFPSRRGHGRSRDDHDEYHDAHEGDDLDLGHLPSPPPEDAEEWMSERSREELRELLVRADGIIKERENELGIASAVAKGLYQSNVVLKSKHQELLSRLPLSPVPSNSSPDLPYTATFDSHSRSNSTSVLSSSTSDSALGLIRSPRPASLYNPSHLGPPTRKVAIATADISLLADQNAELLNKLEKLEAEATSADHAGRRELKRLEKEITFLREALERTQAKSEELEEKVQDAVVSGEAWRRKKEREARFRAMRGLGRERVRQQDEDEDEGLLGVRNFAPTGSRFGGPTERYSLFPSSSSSTSTSEDSAEPRSLDSDADLHLLASHTSAPPPQSQHPAPAPIQPDQTTLIAQLLTKVQELEETNARILQQQTETASQLSAVQRDTAHITKVYETLADGEGVELALDEDEGEDIDTPYDDEGGDAKRLKRRDSRNALASSTASNPGLNASLRKQRSAMRFVSLRRNIEEELGASVDGAPSGTFVVHPVPGAVHARPPSAVKNRKSVVGLFDGFDGIDPSQEMLELRRDGDALAVEGAQDELKVPNVAHPRLRSSTSFTSTSSAWSEGERYDQSQSHSFWSSSSAEANANASASGRLSPLDFFSPAMKGRGLPLDTRAHTGGGGAQGREGESPSPSPSPSPSASPDFDPMQRYELGLDLNPPTSLPIPSGLSTLQAELSSSLSQQHQQQLHDDHFSGGTGIGIGLAGGTGNGTEAQTPTTSASAFNHHFRTSSLYDLSQISVPPTPSPVSRGGVSMGGGAMTLEELGGGAGHEKVDRPGEGNSLKLSVDPPTPHKDKQKGKDKRHKAGSLRGAPRPVSPSGIALSDAVKSPRIKLISETLKSRTNRWVERRLNRSRSNSGGAGGRRGSIDSARGVEFDEEDEERESERERAMPVPIRGRLSNAVDNLIEGFNGFSSKALGRIGSRSRSGSKSTTGSKSRSRSRSREGERVQSRGVLAVDTANLNVGMDNEAERAYTPPPLSPSPPSSASSDSEAGDGEHHQLDEELEHEQEEEEDRLGFRSRLRRRRNHRRQASAPLLIYTDSGAKSKIRPKAAGKDNKLTQSTAQNTSAPSTSSALDPLTTASTTLQKKPEPNNPGLLLQVWMWFQFAVVVLVFVYAMAKRGPGSVLAP
ncbi:hypothetical protein CVT26_003654, partial [Gymnopilus dilepis]